MATTNVSANENKNNNNVMPFDWGKFENSEEGKKLNQQIKIENLEDEVKRYNSFIQKKKKDITRLERSLRVAERELRVAKRELKAAKEAERAERIKALLEANKGKRVIIEDNFPFETEQLSGLAEEIKVSFQYDAWALTCLKEHWSISINVVEKILVDAGI